MLQKRKVCDDTGSSQGSQSHIGRERDVENVTVLANLVEETSQAGEVRRVAAAHYNVLPGALALCRVPSFDAADNCGPLCDVSIADLCQDLAGMVSRVAMASQ